MSHDQQKCPGCHESPADGMYGGMCVACFVGMTPSKRDDVLEAAEQAQKNAVALARAEHPIPVTHEKHEHITQHINPPQSRLLTSVIALLGGSVGGFAGFWIERLGQAKGWW